MRAEAAVALVNGGVQTEERLDVLRFEDIGLGERRLFDIKGIPHKVLARAMCISVVVWKLTIQMPWSFCL